MAADFGVTIRYVTAVLSSVSLVCTVARESQRAAPERIFVVDLPRSSARDGAARDVP
jgi:hypothetical protein